MPDTMNTRQALEERLLSKQKEIVERLSDLKTDLTHNPLADVARSHPLATVAAALAAGLFVGLLMKRSRADSALDPTLMTDALTEKILSELPSSARNHFTPDELRSVVRAEALASLSAPSVRYRPPSLVRQILGTIGQNLLVEGLHQVVSRLTRQAGPEE